MKLRSALLSILAAVGLCVQGAAQEVPALDSLLYEGSVRYHYLFIPPSLLPERPLVVMLHGYGGKAEGYRPEMLTAAREEGFAGCIPQGLKAPNGKTGWYVGYPAQEGMRTDDDAFVCHLAREVARKHGLRTLFLTGMSNGGEMCYLIGRKEPRTFRAIASVAGLTMKWVADSVAFHGPVPFMEIHGTADKTSRWEGDLEGQGGWGAYLPVEDAVAAWVKENGCTPCAPEPLPLLHEDSHPVVLHRWEGGTPANGLATEVLLYEVQGGKHSWALKDMDTCRVILQFFRRWLNADVDGLHN